MKKLLVLAILVLAQTAYCDNLIDQIGHNLQSQNRANQPVRFVIVSLQDNNGRETAIQFVRDTATGKEYLVSGTGWVIKIDRDTTVPAPAVVPATGLNQGIK